MNDKPRYHHGDLRNALLKAGLDILEEEGLTGLSLRAVAARAGVSRSAPAYPFGNLKGLLTALVTIAYIRFAAAMADERSQSARDPVEQMRAAARGYIAFARRNPALFRLMFSSVQVDGDNAEWLKASGAAHQHLVDISRPAADLLGARTDAERQEIANLVWTSTHGYAHLLVDGRMTAPNGAEPDPPPDITQFLFGRGARWCTPERKPNAVDLAHDGR
jgi:AcrR family transcriptional regulator